MLHVPQPPGLCSLPACLPGAAEVIKEAIAGIGENIQIRRFERFVLGEGIEVAKADLAADVEAQTKAMQVRAGSVRPQLSCPA